MPEETIALETSSLAIRHSSLVRVVAHEKARLEARPLFAATNPSGFVALRLETAEKITAH